MKFDKKIFLDNLDLFMKEKSIKSREIEEAADVSKGYISRLKKADNQSVPGIDFLLTAADKFGISVEALSSINFTMCSDNEKYYINFLNSLISRTTRGEITWEKVSFRDFINKIDNKTDEEVIIEKEPSMFEIATQSIQGKRRYKSTFDYGEYQYESTLGDFYSFSIDKKHSLYMIKVALSFQEEEFTGIELFMTSNNNKKSNVCCVSPHVPQKYDALLYRLYETVMGSINVNFMDKETKSVIDSFMNY